MRLAIMILAILSIPGMAFSATWYVDDDNTTGPWLGTLLYPFQYIQSGITAAANGDTVLVMPGTYVENIDFLGKAITVVSQSGPAVTVIDGNQMDCVVAFIYGEGADSVLEGFTVTNGSGSYNPNGNYAGGGIYCWDSAPTIRKNKVTMNQAAYGGGIYCNNNAVPPYPTITLNTISGNEANYGGGIYCSKTSPVITDNVIELNTAVVNGAGMACPNSSATISNNTVQDNTAGSSGGGIRFSGGSTLIVEDNIIQFNDALTGPGGGVSIYNCSGNVVHNLIKENSADWAGGIFCAEDVELTFSKNTIHQNHSATYGGGIYCYDTSTKIVNNDITQNTAITGSGGIHVAEFADPVISGNTIEGNETLSATAGGGGGIGFLYGSTGVVSNNRIAYNSTPMIGGGISCLHDASPTMVNNLIYGNTANWGGGIDCCDNCSSTVINNTIFNNEATNFGGGVASRLNSSITVVNSILWDNTAPTGPEGFVTGSTNPSTLTISYSDVKGGQTSITVHAGGTLNWDPGMINANPQFVEAFLGDFHLYCTSPCCEAGDNTVSGLPAEDFEGDPRISSGTVDMGADEFSTHLYWTGDATPGGTVALKFVGPPGAKQVALVIGFNVFDPPLPGAYGNWYIAPPMILIPGLPEIQSNGYFVLAGALPASIPGPYTIYLQAMINYQLTNLCVMDVK